MQKLYNLMAESIAEIIDHAAGNFYSKYSGRSMGIRRKEMEAVKMRLPELFLQGTQAYRAIEKSDEFGTAFLCHLEELLHTSREEKNYRLMLRTLELLDGALEHQLLRELESAGTGGTEACLNLNRNIVGIGIVPRCECYWERQHRASQHYDRIDNFFQNLLVIDYRELNGFHVCHHYLPPDLFYRAEQKGELTVAVSPFKATNDFTVSYYERDNTSYFSAQYNGEEEKDNRRIAGIITKAAEETADILIFPEMLGNTEMVEEIADYLQNPFWLEQNSPPALIVLPTVCNQKRNTAYLLNRTGGIICGQNKQKAYPMPDSGGGCILEDIEQDYVIHLIHGIGIGRMAIMICRDFVDSDYLNLMVKQLKVTLLLIPSYSTGFHDFDMMAGRLQATDCCALWVNACAVVRRQNDKEKNTGFVLRAGKNRESNGARREFFQMKKPCQEGICPELCLQTAKMYYHTKIAKKTGEEDTHGKQRIL